MSRSVAAKLRTPLRELRRAVRTLRASLSNSWHAFVPVEHGYRLEMMRVGGFDVAYRAPTADELVIADSFDRDIFFSAIPEYAPKPSDVIVDVGAHIGTFSLLASSLVPHGRVHAIEPSRETYLLLKINVALNSARNVSAHNFALLDQRETATLHHDAGNWGHSVMHRLTSHGELVSCRTLTDFMEAESIATCQLAKFNCEGAEFPILLSTPAQVLARFERLLVLYHCDLARGYELESLLGHLRACGFALRLMNQTEDRGWIFATQPLAAG